MSFISAKNQIMMERRKEERHDLKIEIFANGANLEDMVAEYRRGRASSFTTNPSLRKKAGIRDYRVLAEEAVRNIPDLPVSDASSLGFSILSPNLIIRG